MPGEANRLVREIHTDSAEQTRRLGRKLASQARAGDLYLLTGDLGTGKTAFVQGYGEGLGVREPVSSPTFVILKEYESGLLPLYHIDLYRVGGEALDDLGWEEVADQGVTMVEWADLASGSFPSQRMHVQFSRIGDQDRSIRFAAMGSRYEELLERTFPE